MSKERLNYLRRKTADEAELWAADRIEELEREIERKMSAAAFVLKERDVLQADRDEWKARAEFSYRQRDELNRLCEFNEKTMNTLQADNARLREVLSHILRCIPINGFAQIHWDSATWADIDAALAATPEQSLARIRNQVLEKVLDKVDRQHTWITNVAVHALIRAMKEPE